MSGAACTELIPRSSILERIDENFFLPTDSIASVVCSACQCNFSHGSLNTRVKLLIYHSTLLIAAARLRHYLLVGLEMP